ncbi:MAG: DUF3823 domain-containing protein [Bacteroidota bacterium]
MKYLSNISLIFFALLMMIGCGKDNYEPPKSVLTGKVVYNNQSIGVRGTNSTVRLNLWQRGHELYTAIPVYVTQDGTFSALLFDGDYSLVTQSGNGPWATPQDTVKITVKGDTYVEYPVTPFYTISNENITLSGNTLTATFNVSQVTGTQALERAILVINKTAFVDENANIQRVDRMNPGTGQITMTMTITEANLKNVVLNARVGVKIQGREAIYTPVKNIK